MKYIVCLNENLAFFPSIDLYKTGYISLNYSAHTSVRIKTRQNISLFVYKCRNFLGNEVSAISLTLAIIIKNIGV
jgi:hypothetical protein